MNLKYSILTKEPSHDDYFSIVICCGINELSLITKKQATTDTKKHLEMFQELANGLKIIGSKPKPGSCIEIPTKKYFKLSLLIGCDDENFSTFSYLTLGRKFVSSSNFEADSKVLVYVVDKINKSLWLESLLAAAYGKAFKHPVYGLKAVESPKASKIYLDFWMGDLEKSERSLLTLKGSQTASLAEAGNLVRELALTPGNYLDCKSYRNRIEKETSGIKNLKLQFYDLKKLKQMKAGAFLAVAQGSHREDAGIVELTLKSPAASPKKRPLVCLVGKGVVYDTGGTNLKPAASMFGMHQDMTGSAVALASFLELADAFPDLHLKCYLAIVENNIGPAAYKQNDVVIASNGTSIEIVHTDAEGRMILADTLALASQEKPDLLIDFATLTGSCVAAVGTKFSGAFSKKGKLNQLAREAGEKSGERVWPFPMDADLGEALKSEVADTKQCLLKGGVDHIEAALFLQKFTGSVENWLHIDLSSAENEGGLGPVDTNTTGFGVRFCLQFVKDWLKGAKEDVS